MPAYPRAHNQIVLIATIISLATAAASIALVLYMRSRIFAFAEDARRRMRELRDRAEAAENERRVFLTIMNGLGEGMVALDRDRSIVLANRRFVELFEIAGIVAGKKLADVVRNSAVFAVFDRALEGTASTERIEVKFGVAERRIEARAFPIRSERIAAVALFIDVTKLEMLEQMRQNFISDFSHEVRTPLAGLRSAVETFDAGPLSEADEQQLRRIMLRQLLRLERLVHDLSELSRIESGDVTLERETFDLHALVTDVAEDFGDRATQHRVTIHVSGEPVEVYADPMRIQQAVANLIDNAIKYGGDGKEVRIAVADRADRGVLFVSDEGEGIRPGDRGKIFHRFYRVDKSRSQTVTGTGLGLAVTKHLILQHGGTIDVESEPGKGATFIVTLPKG